MVLWVGRSKCEEEQKKKCLLKKRGCNIKGATKVEEGWRCRRLERMATGKARKVAGGFIEKDCTVKVPLNLD